MSQYTDKGYQGRLQYLDSLAVEYNLPRDQVLMVATLLGPTEDFDGLLSELEYMANEVAR